MRTTNNYGWFLKLEQNINGQFLICNSLQHAEEIFNVYEMLFEYQANTMTKYIWLIDEIDVYASMKDDAFLLKTSSCIRHLMP